MTIRTDTIVTRYEVVTFPYEEGIDKIKAKQQQLALQLKDWNASAAETERIHTQAWKAVAVGIAGVGIAIAGARAAFMSYAHEQQAIAAAGTVDLGRLSEAAGGLKTNMELLQFAAAANHGAFRLTSDEMNVALGAMRELTREGYNQEEVTQKVTQALVKLEGDGLKDFGVRVRAGSTDAEKFANMMEALAGKAKLVDGASATGAESIQTLGVRFEDATDRIKNSVGEMVVSLGPLLNKVAALAEGVASMISAIPKGWGQLGALFTGDKTKFANAYGHSSMDEWQNEGAYEGASTQDENLQAAGAGLGQIAMAQLRTKLVNGATDNTSRRHDRWEAFNANPDIKIDAPGAKKKGGSDKGTTLRARAWNILDTFSVDDVLLAANMATGGKAGAGTKSNTYETSFGWKAERSDDDVFAQGKNFEKIFGNNEANWAKQKAARSGRQASFLESTFGKIEEFNAYGKAFQGLQSAGGAAFSAWITGSESMGKAFKRAVVESLSSSASQMFGQSLLHAAYALGSVAFGDVPGAAKHSAAAGAYLAGSIVLGGLAKTLGGGEAATGSKGGSASAGGSIAPSSGSAGAPQQSGVTVVVGNSFAYETPRQRMLAAKRITNDALGAGDGAVKYL